MLNRSRYENREHTLWDSGIENSEKRRGRCGCFLFYVFYYYIFFKNNHNILYYMIILFDLDEISKYFIL